jgi:1-acyl-sn-glycerol-3-phosphate acyltransferase
VRLPRRTWRLRLFRRCVRLLCRILVSTCTRPEARGLENYPRTGPALIVTNHLGDADAALILAFLPEFPELIGAIELRSIAVLRVIMDGVGTIWVHRGRPDRRAVSAGLEALQLGRRLIVAPEGRQSLTGALEQGTDGAAFLALRAGVPVVPVTVTGTEDRKVYGSLKRLRRAPVALAVGKPFELPGAGLREDAKPGERRAALEQGTRLIMEALARQLPPEYRGVYAYVGDGWSTASF